VNAVAAILLASLVAQTIPPTVEGGSPTGTSEYELKAAFLYRFANFIQWPELPAEKRKTPFIIGVAGPDPFGRALDDALKGKTVRGREVIVKRWPSVKDVDDCDILFIGAETSTSSLMLSVLKGRPILTVSDTPTFLDRGGMINLVTEGTRLRFDVNSHAAHDSGLAIGSHLLSIARNTR